MNIWVDLINDDWVDNNEENLYNYFFYIMGDMYKHRYKNITKYNIYCYCEPEYNRKVFIVIHLSETSTINYTLIDNKNGELDYSNYQIWLRNNLIDKII